MAYNPFNIFRRNQKAIFAVITVFIMFTFVLSSGLGGGADFFDWLPRWLGQKSRKGDVVCSIDGSKVYTGELDQLRFNRVMANRFMALAAQQAIMNIMQYQDEQLRSITNEEMRRLLIMGPQAEQQLRNPQFQLMRSLNPEMALQTERLAQAYAAIPTSPTAPAAAKEVVRLRLYSDILQFQLARGGSELYFINAPNRNQRDLINFLLWQKKADQLGVRFSSDDVTRLIQHEFYGFFKSDVEIRKYLQQGMTGFNMDRCLAAIGEEFRVRTAQVATLGPGLHARADRTFGGAPVFSPAYELFDFYRDQVSPTTYEVVAVPGADFTDKVVGEPTEAELKKLYDDYQNQEYDPAKQTPGFKIPRTIKLAWVGATGAEPYYLKKAEEKLKNEELQRALGALGAVQALGTSPAAAWLARPFVVDPLAEEYTRQIEAEHNRRIKDWSGFFGDTRLLDTSVVRSPIMAAVAGGLAGGQLTLGGPLPGLALLDAAAGAMERRDRIKAGMPLFLGALPGPSLLATAAGGEVAFRTLLPRPLPIEAVKADLLKKQAEQTARDLLVGNPSKKIPGDLQTFADVVGKLSGAGGFVARLGIPKFIDDFVAERGWQRGESAGLHDEWTIEDDPGLAPLKAALAKTPHGNQPVRFGQKFFWADTRPGEPKTAATGNYKPEFYPNPPSPFESPEAKPEPKYLVWRTEETPSKAPGSLNQVRDAVKAAWKRIKARELAKAKAESLANAIQSSGGDNAFVIEQNVRDLAENLRSEFADPKARDRIKVFQIPGVAPLAQSANPTSPFAAFGGLHPFALTPTNDIPYPTAEMTKKLLDERTKSPKTTFVLADEPKDTYYVVTLLRRDPKTPGDFRFDVYRDIGMGPTRDAVLQKFMAESTRKTIESVMGLLKQEFRYEETEEQKKRLDEGEKRGGEQ